MLSKAWQDHYDVFNRLLMMEYGMDDVCSNFNRGPTWKTDFFSQNMVTKI